MGILNNKLVALYLVSIVTAQALTCTDDSLYESGEVDFVKALDQTTSKNLSSDTVGSLTIEGVTDHTGTAQINNSGAAHGDDIAGVRFKLDSESSLNNNEGTLETPDVHLQNYQTVTYTFSQEVTFSDTIILKDLDGSSSDKYIDAATLFYEDTNGSIVEAPVSVVGESLISFNVAIEAQPNDVTLPTSVTGYAPSEYNGVSNDNEKYWVSWDLSNISIKRLIVLYWNNESGDNASGAQGISFESPLEFELCKASEEESSEDENTTQEENTTVTPTPSISLIKSIVSVEDENNNTITDAGDVIHYAFKVENTGDVALQNIVISDDIVEVEGTLESLEVGESDSDTFSASYTISQDDVDAGGVENRATVQAEDSDGTSVDDISDTGTNETLQVVDSPEETETPSPLENYENNTSDPTEDPTTLKIEIVTAHIGDLFWIDENGDGEKDETESIVSGATVELFDENGSAISDIYGNHALITDENGTYGFDVIADNTYYVKFTLPEEYIAKDYQFTSDDIDEDGALVIPVTPKAGDTILTLDAAIECGCDSAEIQANGGDSLSLFSIFMMVLMFLGMGTSLNRETKTNK